MNNQNNEKCHKNGNQAPQRFPIRKPGLCETNPKFPLRYNADPCCNLPKQCQYGYTAQHALNKPHQNLFNQCHSPELPTSHPWFEPS